MVHPDDLTVVDGLLCSAATDPGGKNRRAPAGTGIQRRRRHDDVACLLDDWQTVADTEPALLVVFFTYLLIVGETQADDITHFAAQLGQEAKGPP